MAGVVEGWLLRETTWYERFMLFAAAVFLLTTEMVSDLVGVALFAGVLLLQGGMKLPWFQAIKTGSFGKRIPSPTTGTELDRHGTDSKNEVDENLLQYLREVGGPQKAAEQRKGMPPWKNTLLWAVLSAVGAACFVMGKYNVQVLYLRTWVLALLIASITIVAVFWIVLGEVKHEDVT
jgi:hypothetical protein